MRLEGRKVDPKAALALCMVDEIVPPGELLIRAKTWLLGEGQTAHVKPWDQKGFRVPEAANTPKGMQVFTAGNAMLRAKTMGNYTNAQYTMSCVRPAEHGVWKECVSSCSVRCSPCV